MLAKGKICFAMLMSVCFFDFAMATELDEGVKALQTSQFPEAAMHFQRAADAGDLMAEFNLGLMYARGMGVPKDPAQAVKLYRHAAEHGFIKAQANLGLMLTLGNGVARDDVEADMWYLVAADAGDIGAGRNSQTLEERMSIADIAQAREKKDAWIVNNKKKLLTDKSP